MPRNFVWFLNVYLYIGYNTVSVMIENDVSLPLVYCVKSPVNIFKRGLVNNRCHEMNEWF